MLFGLSRTLFMEICSVGLGFQFIVFLQSYITASWQTTYKLPTILRNPRVFALSCNGIQVLCWATSLALIAAGNEQYQVCSGSVMFCVRMARNWQLVCLMTSKNSCEFAAVPSVCAVASTGISVAFTLSKHQFLFTFITIPLWVDCLWTAGVWIFASRKMYFVLFCPQITLLVYSATQYGIALRDGYWNQEYQVKLVLFVMLGITFIDAAFGSVALQWSDQSNADPHTRTGETDGPRWENIDGEVSMASLVKGGNS